MRLEKEKESLVREISYLERENGRLESLYNEYAKGNMTAIECENAGFIIHGSHVLFFQDKKFQSSNKLSTFHSADTDKTFSIEHLRIGWICVSITIISVFSLLQMMSRRNVGVKNNRTDEFSS
jgi:hypothetical protein